MLRGLCYAGDHLAALVADGGLVCGHHVQREHLDLDRDGCFVAAILGRGEPAVVGFAAPFAVAVAVDEILDSDVRLGPAVGVPLDFRVAAAEPAAVLLELPAEAVYFAVRVSVAEPVVEAGGPHADGHRHGSAGHGFVRG